MIVGVVDTGKYRSLTEEATPAIFRAMLQAPNTTTVIAVRSTRPDGEISGVLRDTIRQADAALPVFGLRPLADLLGFVRLPMQVAALALGLFGGVAVVLSATGIYGVVAYAVARRQRELAIRVAVGASRRSVVQLVLSRTACLVGAGLVLGVGAAIAVRGVLSSVVYAPVGGTAWVWPVVVGLVVLVATAASAWPVRRALRIAPVSALAVE